MPTYHFSMTKQVHKLINREKGGLGPREKQDFQRMLDIMMRNPFDPAIHRGVIRSAIDRDVYHAGVDGLRLIWRLVDGREVILAYLGPHDDANDWARRHRIDLGSDGLVRITDALELSAPIPQPKGLFARFTGSRDNIFWHCSDKELVELGVDPTLIPSLRSMKELSALRSIEGTVSPEVFSQLIEQARQVVDIPPGPSDSKIRQSLERYGGGEELVRFVSSEEFKHALEGNMEDWMLFLAPSQRRLVHGNYNGPARVKGVAGSGKTVVAIHRAREMARRNIKNPQQERILFLTYGNRLPVVMRWLLKHLTEQDAEQLGIECRSLYSWVGSLLSRQSIHKPVAKDSQLENYLQQAIDQTKVRYPEQQALWQRPLSFFQDEIRYRIKGRDALDEQTYLALPRTGRGTPLRENARRAMFAVTIDYQQRLEQAGVYEWEDLILAALHQVDPARHSYRYVGAVVDELQDLTEATLKLIRKMVVPGTDDLFLVGDGTQRIYKGGFSLNQIGISVRGRETVLHFNYRNTGPIMRLASAIMQGVKIDDLDDQETIDVPTPDEAIRGGETPALRLFSENLQSQMGGRNGTGQAIEIQDIATEIQALKEQHGYQNRDFAILFRNRRPYIELAEQHLGFPTTVLDKNDDKADIAEKLFGHDSVKLVTMHSAKGLEFKVVFIVGASDDLLPGIHKWETDLSPEEQAERIEEERRLLYVAVTRARDLLYITCPPNKGMTRFLRPISEDILCRLQG